MNTNVENLLGCFYRLMHDRGKELFYSFNGGFDELGDIRIRERGGVINNREFQSEFDFQFQEDSSMESGEASHHPYMVDLIRNGDSEASRQQTNNGSEILEAKIQALCNFVKRSPIEKEGIKNSHPIATSEIMLNKFHRGFAYDAENEYSVFEKAMAVNETNGVLIETEEDLVKAEVLLVDEELEIGINCGDVYANIEINDESYDAENEEVKMSENGAANAIIGTEMSENGAAKNGLLQIIFNDPFYDAIKSVLVNDKMHLVLAIRIAMVEIKCWLIVGSVVFITVMCFQDSVAAGIGAQWLRGGVG